MSKVQQYTNNADLPLSVAVWLATDSYNHDDSVVSVTRIIKPLRELILTERVDPKTVVSMAPDILSMQKSRVGTAVHTAIESAWLSPNLGDVLYSLGFPKKTVNSIVINPDPNNVPKGKHPVYLEHTAFKTFMDLEFRGSSDFIFQGRLTDFKNTSVYGFNDSAKDNLYMLQGSLYRWMSPHIITQAEMDIVQIYSDWSKMGYIRNPTGYPPNPIYVKKIPLMSIKDTEKYVKNKINLIDQYFDASQHEIPECTDVELWRKEPVYKYYKDPNSRSKSTRNYTNYADAIAHLRKDGNIGVVDTVKSKVVACRFCPALSVCDQAKGYLNTGELEL